MGFNADKSFRPLNFKLYLPPKINSMSYNIRLAKKSDMTAGFRSNQ